MRQFRVWSVLGLVTLLVACSALSGRGGTAQVTTITVQAPTATPAATPDIDATVGAAVAATVQALAFPTAAATPTSTVARFTDDTWGLAVGDVFTYRGVPVALTGRVVATFQLPGNQIGFLMYTDPVARQGPAVIAPSPDAAVKGDDYVQVQGKVQGQYQGVNAGGQAIQAPQVTATSVQVITRETAIAPAIKTYTVKKTITQLGVDVTVDRVELAKQETRLYLTVSNKAAQKVSLDANAVRLLQNQQQYTPQPVGDAGYPQLPTELVPGAKAGTVLLFGPVAATGALQVYWDGVRFLTNTGGQFAPFQWAAGG